MIRDLHHSDGTLETRDDVKAAILNDFFAGIFTSENPSTILELTTDTVNQS